MHLVVVGGSDAGISAALRARELDPTAEVTVVVADAYPNFSICGIPYYISGEVTHWRNLAHRTHADLEATGMQLRLDTRATVDRRRRPALAVRDRDGSTELLGYDELVVGTGAVPVRPPIDGPRRPRPRRRRAPAALDGRHLRPHRTASTASSPKTALIVGAGYVGLEMAEGLTARGIAGHPGRDAARGAADRRCRARRAGARRARSGTASTSTPRTTVTAHQPHRRPRPAARRGPDTDGQPLDWDVDLVLVVVGVRPDTDLLVRAGAPTGPRGAVVVDETMATGLPHVWAAGDCVVTHHRLLGATYLPLGTTAHKQGRVAGENALGGTRPVRRKPRHPGRQGLRPRRRPHRTARARGRRRRLHPGHHHRHARRPQGLLPGRHTHHASASPATPDRPAARRPARRHPRRRDRQTRRHLRHCPVPRHDRGRQIRELDLSYTPPLGSPWDAVQMAAQAWVSEHQLDTERDRLKWTR